MVLDQGSVLVDLCTCHLVDFDHVVHDEVFDDHIEVDEKHGSEIHHHRSLVDLQSVVAVVRRHQVMMYRDVRRCCSYALVDVVVLVVVGHWFAAVGEFVLVVADAMMMDVLLLFLTRLVKGLPTYSIHPFPSG